ncbi:MAG: MFS transporter, partial [Verrucomicrobiales bacterium]|nr:MFS transporter [Verrucomicrobiales bacterium]
MGDSTHDENRISEPTGSKSLAAVLFVQTQNAFNDNFVKFVLIGLAMVVAAGTAVGDDIEFILTAMIPIPFILLAPVAGYLSDRFSKKLVLWWCVVGQFLIFAFIAVCVWKRNVHLAVFGFFLLAVQSTIFSPAKQGILKELVGTARLSFANGLMSMLTMVGILGGMILAGVWYDTLLAGYNAEFGESIENNWKAALITILGIGAGSVIAMIICLFVRNTPSHPSEKFTPTVLVRHFVHLRDLFKKRVLKLTALYITWYWFVANFLGLGFVAFAKSMFSDLTRQGLLTATGKMMSAVGIGLIAGSLLVSFLSKNRIRLPLSPIGGIGMAIGFCGAGLLTAGSPAWYSALGVIGFASAFYVVPLNAHLQDRADESSRGRVISALNLMTSFSGVLAIGIGKGLKELGLSPGHQLL